MEANRFARENFSFEDVSQASQLSMISTRGTLHDRDESVQLDKEEKDEVQIRKSYG